MRLRWRLFLTYLLPLGATILVLALSVRSIAIRAVSAHMGGMMDGMMDGMMGNMTDIEQAVARGLTEALLIGSLTGVLVAVGASYVISGRLTDAAAHLAQSARRIAEGHYQERVDYAGSDEIGAFVESFNRMAEGLEETEHTRRELLATISHELRTPLSNIQGYMEGLMDEVVPAEPETYQLVHREAGRLTRLVADIERLSRVEAAVEPLETRPVSADLVARSAVERIRPQFDDTDVTLEFRPGSGTGDVLADEDNLVQVLLNLMENARKYTPEPGAVVVSTERLPGEVRFTVTDTGIGIPAEDLPHIFERFYRVDKSRSTAGGGTGIGLAVARSLVRRMGETSRRPARPEKEHSCRSRSRRPDPERAPTAATSSVSE
ncbi:MAG: ATP-binding protein [Thermoleophilia bacterium]|nr:ATP-binding protein [Thermoleophilia bacterium]